jgi:hypothetical protein
MLEKLAPSTEETATQWVHALDVALAAGDEKALAATRDLQWQRTTTSMP